MCNHSCCSVLVTFTRWLLGCFFSPLNQKRKKKKGGSSFRQRSQTCQYSHILVGSTSCCSSSSSYSSSSRALKLSGVLRRAKPTHEGQVFFFLSVVCSLFLDKRGHICSKKAEELPATLSSKEETDFHSCLGRVRVFNRILAVLI